MKLSPLDIYNKEFKKTTFGYNVTQVNEFLEEMGINYEKLLKEINNLQDENERLKERISNFEKFEETLQNTINMVQDNAKEQSKQAEKNAEILIKRAEIKADEIINETKLKIHDEYKNLQEIIENKNLFKIRFKTLLESHLKMLEEDEDLEIKNINFGKDIASSKYELDE
jgi:cell division initiation protein